MLIYLLQVYVLLNAFVLHRIYGQGCSSGLFGEDCRFSCHCANSTSCEETSGECPGNDTCSLGYFGPGCQFTDLVHLWSNTSAVPIFLRDSDDNTCNPDPKAVSVELIQVKKYSFSWFRIVVNSKTNLLNFTTILNNGEPCSSERKFEVSDTVVDVTCDVIVILEKLRIDGAIAGSICSVYISGGRNIALLQNASQISTVFDASRAVDGSTRLGSYSQTRLHTSPPWWMVNFSRPHILYDVTVHSTDYKSRLVGFKLQTFNQNETVDVEFIHNDTTFVSYVVHVHTLTPVTSVKITQSPSITGGERVLALREVFVFGDTACPNRTYGLFCQHSCNCSRFQRCHVSTGACASGCPAGYYGFKCSSSCSVKCHPQACEWTTGHCSGCKAGYIGNFCDKACEETYYGDLCQARCPPNCLHQHCDGKSGKCFSCEPGYEGIYCETGSLKLWKVMIPFYLIIFFILIWPRKKVPSADYG